MGGRRRYQGSAPDPDRCLHPSTLRPGFSQRCPAYARPSGERLSMFSTESIVFAYAGLP